MYTHTHPSTTHTDTIQPHTLGMWTSCTCHRTVCIIFQTCWTTCDKTNFEEVIGLLLPFALAMVFCVLIYSFCLWIRSQKSITMPSYQYIDRSSIPRRGATCYNSAPQDRINEDQGRLYFEGFYSRRKNPKHRSSKISQMSNFQSEYRKENHVLSIWRRDSEWHSGVSNQYEYSRIRNFGAKSIRFVSRFTENIIK